MQLCRTAGLQGIQVALISKAPKGTDNTHSSGCKGYKQDLPGDSNIDHISH